MLPQKINSLKKKIQLATNKITTNNTINVILKKSKTIRWEAEGLENSGIQDLKTNI